MTLSGMETGVAGSAMPLEGTLLALLVRLDGAA